MGTVANLRWEGPNDCGEGGDRPGPLPICIDVQAELVPRSFRAKAWYQLGLVLSQLGEIEAACAALQSCIDEAGPSALGSECAHSRKLIQCP